MPDGDKGMARQMPLFVQRFRMYRPISGIYCGLTANFNGRRMFGKLGNHDLTFVQLFRMMKTGGLSPGQSEHLNAILLCFNDNVVVEIFHHCVPPLI